MRVMVFAVLAGALAGCGNYAAPKGDDAQITRESVFPKTGEYRIVMDRWEGNQMMREETDMWVDASNPTSFEELVGRPDGANCRDRQVDIGNGRFSVRMTCDAHDGDIHNIGIQRQGSYSRNSIDIETVTTLWGTPIRETRSYRLKTS